MKRPMCFPGDAIVTERKRGRLRLSEVQTGDSILTVVEGPTCSRSSAPAAESAASDVATALSGWSVQFEDVSEYL